MSPIALAHLRDAGPGAGPLYERLVLDALGIDHPPLDRWRAAYARLSEALTADRAVRLASSPSATWGGDDERAVAALVYGQRTFLTLTRIFAAYAPGPGPLVDLGSGSGAAALAAMVHGAPPATLVDASADALALARRVFAQLGVEIDARVRADLAAPSTGVGTIVAAHSLNEARARGGVPGSDARMVRGWRDALAPGGRVFVLEPGLKETSRALQALRDELRDEVRILAPCTHSAPCPLLPRTNDWCHLTWHQTLGPLATQIVSAAGHDARRVVFSWFVAERGMPVRSDLGRLLQVRPAGKGKLAMSVCTEAGMRDLVALERGDVGTHVRSLPVGAVVALEDAHLVQRGDGERLERPGGLHVEADV